MAETIKNKTVLITGGTGSFGRAVLDRLRAMKVREIRIFSRDELKQELMRIEMGDPSVKFMIGDVRSRESVDAAMRGVDYVFHAAALKQVPSCEFFPMQAVYTNIVGSHNVVESAIAHKVRKVIVLSTDKAVYPINAMGMTKALMEKVAQSAAREAARSAQHRDTVIAAVRYGNVMLSRGSVIPLFVRQLREGKPMTVTEPSMTRFLLPLTGAIDLILFAFRHAQPGDVFIKKSPACTLGDLALALNELLGGHGRVKRIGMRHGEKIFETLASREELLRAQDMGDYFRVPMDVRDLNYSKYFSEGDRREVALEDYTSHSTQRLSVAQVKRLLATLPEFRAEAVDLLAAAR